MPEIVLSVVMPSLASRLDNPTMTRRIVEEIDKQIGDNPYVEFISLIDNGRMSIGAKMDILNTIARGKFICGVGDDDMVTSDYIETLLEAIHDNPDVDVISFDLDYFTDNRFIATIKESIQFKRDQPWHAEIWTGPPSPKCAIKAKHCKAYSHPDSWHGEDQEFMKWVLPRLETEFYLDKVLYKYYYRTGNNESRKRLAGVAHAAG